MPARPAAAPLFGFRQILPFWIVLGIGFSLALPPVLAQDAADDGTAAKYKKFEEALSGVALVGNFTIVGKETPAKPERYEIRSVRKLEEEDLWLFRARIKYGDKDVEMPIPVPVKWAGNTPVISLDNLTIPNLGTFSSYVVIDGDKYAGTWTHGEVSGHMFGQIEKLKDEAE